jgi:hypothetical protein
MSFIRADGTYADYVGPSGRVYPLAGPKQGSMGIQMLESPEGLLGPPGTVLTDGAARQRGKDFVGVTVDPVELDIDFDVWGKTAHDWAVVNRMWLDDWRFDKQGWIRFYTSDFGWRWIRVRKGKDHRGASRKDSRLLKVARYSQVALAEFPYWRSADYEATWTQTANTVARLKLWNGGDVDVWPQITLKGQCAFRIKWGVNNYETPVLAAGETAVISAEPFEQSIRSNQRNLLPALKGKYFQDALEAGKVTEVTIDIVSGTGAQIQARVPQLFERPM